MRTSNLTLSAGTAGSHFASDPELSLPNFPRFPPEILIIPYGQSGLLFEGARGSQVLNGRGARGFIPVLLKKLDGTHSLASLLSAFPELPPKSVYDAISLLYSRGLLEDGISDDEASNDDAVLSDLAAFAGRYADVTRVNRNRGDALARLAKARLAIAGDARSVESVATALQGQGIGRLDVVTEPDRIAEDVDLLIAMFVGEHSEVARWLDAAHARKLRVLHSHVGQDTVEVGPLFIPGRSACHGCFRQLRARPHGGVNGDDLGYWAGIVALHAFHLLSRIGTPNLYNICHVHKRTAYGDIYEGQKLARLPGCAVCGLQGRTPTIHQRNGHVWLLHNAANGMPPRELLSPRDYQFHYAPANIAVTKDVPEPFYGAQGVALPEGIALDAQPSWLRASVVNSEPTLDSLATLLRFGVGYQWLEGGKRRIAPGGGGLGSAEMLVVARGVEGLENGVYHYYAHTHRLDRLREASDALIIGALGLTDREMPPLLLIGLGSLRKLRQKYNNFAFRFANLDAGFVRIFLHETLSALGLPFVEYPEVRDKVIAHATGVPTVGGRYVITYVMGVGSPRGEPGLEMVEPYQYVDALIDLSSKRDSAIAKSQRELPALAQMPHVQSQALGTLLLGRRSVRSFALRAIPGELLGTIAALAVDANDWLTRSGGTSVEMKLWVGVTVGDDEYPPGIYLWDPEQTRLVQRRAGLVAEELDATMLQRNLARAPAVFFITGNFEHAVEHHGARGYRELIGRAGAIASRALIAATAYGVSGCPWGGLAEDAWGEMFGIDRYRDCPMFGFSLGYPSEG